jgi:hypothetical protein
MAVIDELRMLSLSPVFLLSSPREAKIGMNNPDDMQLKHPQLVYTLRVDHEVYRPCKTKLIKEKS